MQIGGCLRFLGSNSKYSARSEFVRYVDHIWRLIEDDVRASVIEEKV